MSIQDELAKRRSKLTAKQSSLLGKRRQGISAGQENTGGGQPRTLPILKRPGEETAPASFAQQRLWFLQQLEPDSGTYNEFTAVRLKGRLDRDAFVKSLQEILHRHEILRTSLVMIEKQVRQIIDHGIQKGLHLCEIDLRTLPDAEREEDLQQRIKAEIQRPFKLAQGELWRNTIFRLKEDETFFLAVMHHAICDGWSLSIFGHEIAALYSAYLADQPSPLPEPPIQYADYAYWQRQTLEGETLSRQLAYWKRQLGGELPVLDLSSGHLRPTVQSNQGGRRYFVLPPSLSQELRAFSIQEGVTLFMTLLAAFNILLYRYTGQEDLIVGTPVAGRTCIEFEHLIGFFTNTLALRCDLKGKPNFRQLVQRVRAVALEAYSNQDVPFEKVVEHVSPDRTLSHAPIFQTMFILQNVPEPVQGLAGLTLIPEEIDSPTAKFDLEIDLQETESELSGYVEYSSDLFDAASIERLIGHFQQILQGVMHEPELPIAHLPLLTAEEKRTMLATWNASAAPYPTEQRYHELFEEQVKRTPTASAVIDGHEQLTYYELNQRANRLAQYLLQASVKPDMLVALITERSWQLLVAILAVYKAGGAYLPLDCSYPLARLKHVLADSGSRFVLTTTENFSPIHQALSGDGIEAPYSIGNIDDILQEEERFAGDNVSVATSPLQLAYVIYTSGSTGQPKGVMIEQRGMLNHLYAKIRDLGLSAMDRVAETASQCFDISVWQMLAPLLVGARVDFFPDIVTHDPLELFKQAATRRITVLETVPALMRVLLESLQKQSTPLPDLMGLRWLLLTGEALPPELVQRWFQLYPNIPLLNAYGPTECSDDVAHHVLSGPLEGTILHTPIGRPVANMQLYVLNQMYEPLPIGITGELYVGGTGVGRGYLGDPAQTAETFIANPFSKEAGTRLYKTGDFARWLPDGTLEYNGRSDAQIKVRGYRIEPGEIEAVMVQHPAVQQCVVTVREDPPSLKCLVAYVTVRHASLKPVDLAQFLKEHLPDYMVPAAFVFLENMPLTSNGKIDRQALPAPEQQSNWQDETAELPRSALESVLALIWSELLEVAPVNIHKNFFELGGHSLLAAQFMAQISDMLMLDLPLHWLFEAPTIAGLAQIMLQDPDRREKIEKAAQTIVQVLNMSEDEVVTTLQEMP